jgi:hypothetical protein
VRPQVVKPESDGEGEIPAKPTPLAAFAAARAAPVEAEAALPVVEREGLEAPPVEHAGALVVRPRNLPVEEVAGAADQLYEEVVEETAAAAMPAVEQVICLGECLPAKYFIYPFDHLLRYRWSSEARATRAGAWLEAAVVSGKAKGHFYVELEQFYHEDRALKAARDNNAPSPIQEGVSRSIKGNQHTSSFTSSWTSDLSGCTSIPIAVTDRLASFLKRSPDVDEVGEQDFRFHGGKGSRRLYARFGSWFVEIAAWEY